MQPCILPGLKISIALTIADPSRVSSYTRYAAYPCQHWWLGTEHRRIDRPRIFRLPPLLRASFHALLQSQGALVLPRRHRGTARALRSSRPMRSCTDYKPQALGRSCFLQRSSVFAASPLLPLTHCGARSAASNGPCGAAIARLRLKQAFSLACAPAGLIHHVQSLRPSALFHCR